MKELLFQQQEANRYRGSVDGFALAEIAAILKGVVVGREIHCPSPGFPDDDRSCCVRINPAYPAKSLFIYYSEGPEGKAYDRVQQLLGLDPDDNNSSENTEAARKIWRDTVPAPGSIVESYLRSRGITVPIPDCIRYHGKLKHLGGGEWPAMVTEVVDETGRFIAIHRTFLNYNGKGKAPITPAKMALGPTKGGCARLSPIAPKLVIAEGIETTLSAMQLSGLPGWAGLSSWGMRDIPLPPEVHSVVIAVDLDNEGIGEKAGRIAAKRLAFEGRAVSIARPTTGKDFNDVLLAGAADE